MPDRPSAWKSRLRRTARNFRPLRRRRAASRLPTSSRTVGVVWLEPASPASRGPIPKRTAGRRAGGHRHSSGRSAGSGRCAGGVRPGGTAPPGSHGMATAGGPRGPRPPPRPPPSAALVPCVPWPGAGGSDPEALPRRDGDIEGRMPDVRAASTGPAPRSPSRGRSRAAAAARSRTRRRCRCRGRRRWACRWSGCGRPSSTSRAGPPGTPASGAPR